MAKKNQAKGIDKTFDLDKMDRTQLEAFIQSNGLSVTFDESTTDEALRDAIEKAVKAQSKQNTKDALYEQAKKVAQDNNVSTIYANSKGEFFTVKNYALISESSKEAKIKTFTFESEDIDESTDKDDE